MVPLKKIPRAVIPAIFRGDRCWRHRARAGHRRAAELLPASQPGKARKLLSGPRGSFTDATPLAGRAAVFYSPRGDRSRAVVFRGLVGETLREGLDRARRRGLHLLL